MKQYPCHSYTVFITQRNTNTNTSVGNTPGHTAQSNNGTPHSVTPHSVTSHSVTPHSVTSHSVTSHSITSHSITSHCITRVKKTRQDKTGQDKTRQATKQFLKHKTTLLTLQETDQDYPYNVKHFPIEVLKEKLWVAVAVAVHVAVDALAPALAHHRVVEKPGTRALEAQR